MINHWFIEQYDEDCRRIYEQLKVSGISCSTCTYEPLKNQITNLSDAPNSFYYGSIQGVKLVQRKYHNIQTMASWEYYDYLYTAAYLEPHLLNKTSSYKTQILPIGATKELCLFDSEIFIRPNRGTKCFPGQVITGTDGLRSLIYTYNLFDSDVVVMSPARAIDVEWRLVVHAEQCRVITGSQYKRLDQVDLSKDIPTDVILFVENILQDMAEKLYEPDPIYVMDVCLSNNTLYIMETNAISSSGLYLCDVVKIVGAINDL